jgi:hypothetical protein
MTCFKRPQPRQAAAWTKGAVFAIVVALCTALGAFDARAATPFDVRVTGTGPDELLIPGLASSGAAWDGVVAHLAPHDRCHVFTPRRS